jgi:hypothetical protein
LLTPEIIARTWAGTKNEIEMPEREVAQTGRLQQRRFRLRLRTSVTCSTAG